MVKIRKNTGHLTNSPRNSIIKKRKFNFPLIALVSAVGIPGALFGSFLASRMDTAVLSKIFGAFLTACGIFALFSRK